MTQINLLHTSLLNTEKFLTAIQLVEKISEPNIDKAYSYIIEKIIDSNSKGILNSEGIQNSKIIKL